MFHPCFNATVTDEEDDGGAGGFVVVVVVVLLWHPMPGSMQTSFLFLSAYTQLANIAAHATIEIVFFILMPFGLFVTTKLLHGLLMEA